MKLPAVLRMVPPLADESVFLVSDQLVRLAVGLDRRIDLAVLARLPERVWRAAFDLQHRGRVPPSELSYVDARDFD